METFEGHEDLGGSGAFDLSARLIAGPANARSTYLTDGFRFACQAADPPVTNPSPAHLRLHVEERLDAAPELPVAQLAPLLRSFEQCTGWQLRFEQSPSGFGEVWSTPIAVDGELPAGRLVLATPPAAGADRCACTAVDLQQARSLGLAIGGLLGELNRLRHALWQREAELAAGVPVAQRRGDEPHLAERLESVLKGGLDAVGCVAAGLYLLDETTSELKLRASHGLPPDRLLAPSRPLRGAMADLEALVGHAVVLEDTTLLPHWRCPEDFPAAVCVPVSSPSAPLGTLWVFCDRQRDFSPEETNLLEIVAGRLAAELEREMLLTAGVAAKTQEKQIEAAARWQSDRMPSVAPLLDPYEVSGWTQQAAGIGGDFHDWSVLPDGRLALAVGDAQGDCLTGALEVASLHAALKAHAGYRHEAADLLTRLNDTLLIASPGDQRAALAYALLDPQSGELQLALAGECGALFVRAADRCVITTDVPPLGQLAEAAFLCDTSRLAAGELLVLFSGGVRRAVDGAGQRITEAALAALAGRHQRDSAAGLAARLRKLLTASSRPADDLSVLVLKRRRR